ncbi:hypothetical protein EVAR_84841_1 [Eumeta japonica]|uniref:Uncharacterized protein n=1 Tax=Eumeta variegata TaxID=151549 RepID=A0A4C1U8C5_EUMVA|nr:hypothetical protein EVAR_84841_1 [Eumeta japonica]
MSLRLRHRPPPPGPLLQRFAAVAAIRLDKRLSATTRYAPILINIVFSHRISSGRYQSVRCVSFHRPYAGSVNNSNTQPLPTVSVVSAVSAAARLPTCNCTAPPTTVNRRGFN